MYTEILHVMLKTIKLLLDATGENCFPKRVTKVRAITYIKLMNTQDMLNILVPHSRIKGRRQTQK